MTTKRTLSVLILALAIVCLCSLGRASDAGGTGVGGTDTTIRINTETGFNCELRDGDILAIGNDILLVDKITLDIPSDVTVKLDLNGKTLKRAGDVLSVNGYGTLIIIDSEGNTGKIENTDTKKNTGPAVINNTCAVRLNESVGLQLEGGTITASGGGSNEAVDVNWDTNLKGLIKINGGTVAATGTGDAIAYDGNGSLIVNDGTIKADQGNAINLGFDKTGSLTVKGGLVESFEGCAIKHIGKGKIEISGGKVTSQTREDAKGTIWITKDASAKGKTALEITGATVENTSDKDVGMPKAIFNESQGNVEISGGTISSKENNTILVKKHPDSSADPGELIISGGTISNTLINDNVHASVNVEESTVTISGGEISCAGGTANGGGTVYLNNATLNLYGGTVSHASAERNRYAVYSYLNKSKINIKSGGAVLQSNNAAINKQPTVSEGVEIYGSDKYKGDGKAKVDTSDLPGSYKYLKSIGESTVSPSEATYDKYSNIGAFFTLTLNGNELQNIKNGSDVVPYTKDNNVYTILYGYLNKLDYGKYTFTFEMFNGINPTAQITVQKKQLSISGTTVADKQYDGTTGATVTPGELAGLMGSDQLTVEATGMFADENAGIDKAVTVSYTIKGENKDRYIAPADETIKADITPIPVTSVTVSNSAPLVGDVLSAIDVKPDSATVSYLWQYSTDAGDTWVDYVDTEKITLTLADAGSIFRVIATGAGNYGGSAISASTSAVVAVDASVDPIMVHDYNRETNTNGVTFELKPGSYTFASLKSGGKTLVSGTDYTVNGNVYTIQPNYLKAQMNDSVTLTFEMSGGFNPTAWINFDDKKFLSLAANPKQTADNTSLRLTLSGDVAGLSAEDIAVTGATKGAIAKVENTTGIYDLTISDITGDVTVKLSKNGIPFYPSERTVARAAAPVFGIGAGDYPVPQDMTLTSATDDAVMYYTNDASVPTSDTAHNTNSIVYTGAVEKYGTLKAVTTKDGLLDSPISEVAYTMIPAQLSIKSVEDKDAHWEITGVVSEAGASDRKWDLMFFDAPVTTYDDTKAIEKDLTGTTKTIVLDVDKFTTEKKKDFVFFARSHDYPNCADLNQVFAFTLTTQPVITPADGSVFIMRNVGIAHPLSNGVKIMYTTDGTDPTATNGNEYTAEFEVTAPATVKAAVVGSKTDLYVSPIAEVKYIAPIRIEGVSLSPTAPYVGDTLTAVDITPTGATVSYLWQYSTDAGRTWLDRGTDNRITLTLADAGRIFRVIATGTGNYDGSATSGSTSEVVAIDASATPTSASYDKYAATAGLAFTLDCGSYGFAALKNGADALVLGTDYEVKGGVYTVAQSYLNRQSTGTLTLTFDMDGGSDPEVKISVSDSSPINAYVTPTSAVYDKHTAVSGLDFTLINGSYAFVGITNGGAALVQGADYAVSGNAYRISQDYLNAQPVGALTLVFAMSGGVSPTAVITVSDTKPIDASVTPSFASYDRHTAVAGLDFTLEPGSYAFIGISADGTPLVQGADYTVNGGVYTVSRSFLNARPIGTLTLVFEMDGGADPAAAIDIFDSSIGSASVTPSKATFYQYRAKSGIKFTLDPGKFALLDIRNGERTLIRGTDYKVDGNVYTVKKSYLNSLPAGNITLTFDMDGGNDPFATLAVLYGNGLLLDEVTLGKGKNVLAGNLLLSKTQKKVKWQSDDESVLQIIGKGVKAKLKPVAVGTARLTATFSDGVGVTVPVTVVEKEFAATGLKTKSSFSMRAGEKKEADATVNPSTASDKSIKWLTSDAQVATVDENGVITAVGKGECKIIAITTAAARKAITVSVKK